MKHGLHRACVAQVVGILFGSLVVVPALCQHVRPADPQQSARAQYQEKLKKVAEDKSGYASAIVQRWEDAARSSGRWDKNYATDLHGALMKLSPANLILVGDAPTFPAMMYALATGKPLRSGAVPEALGAASAERSVPRGMPGNGRGAKAPAISNAFAPRRTECGL